MEIILLRHGQPDIRFAGFARANEMPHHINRYDLAPLKGTPPALAIEMAHNCDTVICSTLLRSQQSAAALGIDNIHTTNPIFNEVSLPHFKTGTIKLPIHLWGTLYRLMSLGGFSRHGESYRQAKQRAALAASALIEIAENNQRTLLIGHGFMNHFIAKELRKQRWAGPRSPGRHYWSFSAYRKIS